MELTTLDFILINIISYFGGIVTMLCLPLCDSTGINMNTRNLINSELNHQQILYPNNSPILPAAPIQPVTTIREFSVTQ